MGRVEEKVRELAGEAASVLGYTVEAVELSGAGRRTTLKITIDKEGGVSIEDCAKMSRELGALLDVDGVMASSYNLEVSSPGLDRPLRGPADFRKQTGKLVRVVTREPFDGQNFLIGRLVQVSPGEDWFLIEADGKEIKIPFGSLKRANLEVEL